MREKEFFPQVRLHFDYLVDEFDFEHESFRSQADALRAVIPLLRGPDSTDLLRRSQLL
jgi:hypothetical protein